MPTIKITRDILQEFLTLVESGLTQIAAADKLGQRVDSLRYAAERLGEPWPQRRMLKETVLARIDEIRSTEKTQAEWAKELGASQPRIHVLFKELGLQSSCTRKRKPADHHRQVEEYHQILSHIQQNGGYAQQVIRELGLKTRPQAFRDFVRQIGIDLSHYQFAWQEYGAWLTLPGPWLKTPPCNYIVPAVCRSCGGHYKVSLQNVRAGKSKCCLVCSGKTREHQQVINVQTGEVYRSLRSWASEIGRFAEYQKLRIRIRNEGEVTVDGATYQLRS